MSIPSSALYVILIVSLILIGWARESGLRQDRTYAPPAQGYPKSGVVRNLYDDADLLEIAITASDAVVQNLDASSLAGLALCALPVALLVLLADKLDALPPILGPIVLLCTTGAIIFSYLGYEWGNRFSRERLHDSIDAETLIGAYIRFGDPAIAEAIKGVNKVAAEHRRLRTKRRQFISLAMGSFALGLVVLVWCHLFVPETSASKASGKLTGHSVQARKLVS